MTIKSIPEVGEIFGGYVPAKRELLHITVGGVDAATTTDLILSSAATASYTLVNVDVPIVLYTIYTMVETAFTAVVDLEIGNSTTVDNWSDEATIGATTAGVVLVANATGLSVPAVLAAGADILLDNSGAVAETGLLHVYIEYAVLAD